MLSRYESKLILDVLQFHGVADAKAVMERIEESLRGDTTQLSVGFDCHSPGDRGVGIPSGDCRFELNFEFFNKEAEIVTMAQELVEELAEKIKPLVHDTGSTFLDDSRTTTTLEPDWKRCPECERFPCQCEDED